MSARDAHGHARASVATFASGEVLGGTYRIVGTLETGGMGSLFLAEHVRLGRRFVVKVLANHAKSDPETVRANVHALDQQRDDPCLLGGEQLVPQRV